MKKYKEYIESCLMNGGKLECSHEQHCREKVLEKLIELSETGITTDEEKHMREETGISELLWIIEDGEIQEKGLYSWNKPDGGLLVIASPALMAILMGEYEIGIELCEKGMWGDRNDIASEFGLEGCNCLPVGSSIRFCEACLLCRDMTKEQIAYFGEREFLDGPNLWRENGDQFSDIRFFVNKQVVWDSLYQVLQRVKEYGRTYEEVEDIILLILWYALRQGMDKDNPVFWLKLCILFANTEMSHTIPQALHGYAKAYYVGAVNHYEEQYRLLNGMDMYFRYAEAVDFQYIDHYISDIILTKCRREERLMSFRKVYFSTMKKIEGEVTILWLNHMLELLKTKEISLLEQAFQSGFLRDDCIENYISHLIPLKEYAGIIIYLIHRRTKDEL